MHVQLRGLIAGLIVLGGTMAPVAGADAAGPTAEDYTAAAALLEGNAQDLVKNATVAPHWLGDDGRFWYRRDTEGGHRYVVVDPASGAKTPAFDHDRLAAALAAVLGDEAEPSAAKLGLEKVELSEDLDHLQAVAGDRSVSCDLEAMTCEASPKPVPEPGLLRSPDGHWAAFARNDNLFVRDLEGGEETRLTWDGEPYDSYGKLPDSSLITIVKEKTGLVLPPYGAAWSPDGRFLIAPRIDERLVRVNPFVEWVPTDGSLRPIVHQVRSAFTGDREQLVVDFFVFDPVKKTRVPMQLPAGFDSSMYDGTVAGWSVGRAQAFVLARDYGSKSVALVRVDLKTGKGTGVIEETAATRFMTNTVEYQRPNIRILGDGDEVVWYSERSGWGHLYLYDAQTGAPKDAITAGDWMVLDIHAVDEKARQIFFTGGGREWGRDPYYRHLYRASVDGAGVTLLTEPNGDHDFPADPVPMIEMLFGTKPPEPRIKPEAGVFVDTFSTVDEPPVTVLRSTTDGHAIAELERADPTALYAAGYKPPVREAVKAADGQTDVYTVYYAPNRGGGGGKSPVVDAVYGGPQVFVAPRNFVDAYRATNPIGKAAVARLGFAVTVVDGRGTPGRSNAFRDAGYTEFTRVGIEDHVAAIKQLAERHPEMDLERVGIYGWSWGGTFTAQAILSLPEFYDVAVSGAGVYDYAPMYPGFESYTGIPQYADGSRYRTRPDEEPANWAKLDITAMAANLEGHLMLVYGDMDENVPQSQAFRLVDALIKANKPYDLLYMPNQTHAAAGDGYVIRRTWDYLVEHLLGAEPPADVKVEVRRMSRD